MLYNKKNDPIEVVIQQYRKKVVRTEHPSVSTVLKTYFVRYKEYADSSWAISNTEKQRMISRIKRFEKSKNLDIDQHCKMVDFLFDSVFKPGFEPSLGSVVSNYFYNLWTSKSPSRKGKFKRTSKEKFESKVKGKGSKGTKSLGKKIRELRENGIVK